MIGYQNPELGNQRRRALADYLKQQSAQRSQNAARMRSVGTSAFGGSSNSSYGQPFLKAGRKATPEKFAFAGVKPSLKTLLGLVGRNMGNGGPLPFSIFGADTPVGGLGWGGDLPNPAQTPTPSAPTGGGGPESFTPQSVDSGAGYTPSPPPMNSIAGPNISYGDVSNSLVNGALGSFSGIPGVGLAQILASLGLAATQGYSGPGPTPILGTLKYDQLQ